MNNVYKNIVEYNSSKKEAILIVFHDMIADMLTNKKINPVVTELFLGGRKLNFTFVTQSYFAVRNIIRLNSTHYFVIKIPKKENFNKFCLIISQVLTFKTF